MTPRVHNTLEGILEQYRERAKRCHARRDKHDVGHSVEYYRNAAECLEALLGGA